MNFGNWSVTDKAIQWNGRNEYFIDKSRLHEAGFGERAGTYDWLVHLTEKTWLTVQDIKDLNSAYMYALLKFNVGFSTELSWEKTMIEQSKLLERKQE